jgi:hypothetical protein
VFIEKSSAETPVRVQRGTERRSGVVELWSGGVME